MTLVSAIAVYAFIAVLLFLFVMWDLPPHTFGRGLIRRFARPILYLGLDHDWAMFAPSPPQANYIAEFAMRYADGTTDTVHLEMFGRPGAPTGPRSTRYVKLMAGLLSLEDNALKPSFCRYLARERGRKRISGEPVSAPRVQVTGVSFIVVAQPMVPFGRWPQVGAEGRLETIRRTLYEHEFPA